MRRLVRVLVTMMVTVVVMLQLGRVLCGTYASARVSFGLCLSTT